MIDLAAKVSDVQFRHAAPLWSEGQDPANAAAISATSTRRIMWTASPQA
jgi:hypothetical protein